jgi:fatty-acyl-CoA synthase
VNGVDRSDEANVGGWLAARARLHPERPALIEDASGETLSYGQLNVLSNRVAAALVEAGLRPGDRFGLALHSEPLYLAAYFAAAKLGAILIPLNTRLTAPELEVQLRDAGASLALRADDVELGSAPGLRELERSRLVLPESADEPALAPGGEAPQVLMYTSGTTGHPKGALLPHRKTLYNSLNAERYFDLGPDDVIAAPVPLFHSYGLKILSVPALFCGASVVMIRKFDPVGLQRTLAERRATLLGGVPVMLRRMLRAGLRPECFATLRFAFSAGAALDVETIRCFADVGVPVLQGYGQTETSIMTCIDAEHALDKAGSVGRPVHHGEVRVARPDGETAEPGGTGEVVARGPICMLGYWRQEQATREARLGDWHRTGDIGYIDADGYLYLVGRLKEMYISGGENVYPAEVERVLETNPEVAEAAVVGIPDAEWGEVGRAYVVPAGDWLDVDALLDWTRDRLAGFKRPREVALVAELPRTASGKVQKHLLGDAAGGARL